MEVVDCLVILTAQTLLNSVCTPFFLFREIHTCITFHTMFTLPTPPSVLFSVHVQAVFSLFPAFFIQPYKELGIKEMKIAAVSGKVQHKA